MIKKEIMAFLMLLSVAAALCIPASAISADLFTKDKNVLSGGKACIVATVTDENGNPVSGRTVYFFNNARTGDFSADEVIGQVETDEDGIAVLNVSLSYDGENTGNVFLGCATYDDETGLNSFSSHIMITVTNPDPYYEETED
jgi:hypothetical protein